MVVIRVLVYDVGIEGNQGYARERERVGVSYGVVGFVELLEMVGLDSGLLWRLKVHLLFGFGLGYY